jgi:hypothetical protein
MVICKYTTCNTDKDFTWCELTAGCPKPGWVAKLLSSALWCGRVGTEEVELLTDARAGWREKG